MSTSCPAPPPGLPDLEPGDVAQLDDPVVRIYTAGGRFATTWSAFRSYGPVSHMRFDHHPPPPRLHRTRAVSYAAVRWTRPGTGMGDPLDAAVLERFQDGVLDRHANRPRLVIWKPTRPLKLLLLSDSVWLARAGGNAALLSGARGTARAWARAIHKNCRDLDGLAWSSSVLPSGRSVVLFERASAALPSAPSFDRALDERVLQPALARIATRYNLVLI